MNLTYLWNETITDSDLDLVELDIFSHATKEAEQRDKEHPDNLNDRFNIVTHPDTLKVLQKWFSIFQKHHEEGHFNMENYLCDLDQQVHWCRDIFRSVGAALKIQNLDSPSSAIIINGGPVEEMQQRIKDSVAFIVDHQPGIIIASWWDTQISRDLWYSSEADYINSQLINKSITQNISLETKAQNTWDNAQFVSDLLWDSDSSTTVTTDYWSLRVALTNQCQMPFKWIKRTHGSDFRYNENILWSPNEWWMSESWWKATMYSLSRLIRYRARTDPFI